MKKMELPNLNMLDQVAGEFLGNFTDEKIFAFYGAMGVGKTTFIKALCKQLGATDHVTSPTFAIVNEYGKQTLIYHIDAFRIEDENEMRNIGLESYFNKDAYCFIEWPANIETLLPTQTVRVEMQLDGESRVILIDN